MNESTIEKKVTDHARKLGWISFKFTSPGNRGVPDRIYFKDGKTVLVEFKAPGKDVRPLQRQVIKRIRIENIPVYIIDDKDTGCGIFDYLESVQISNQNKKLHQE